MLRDFSNAQILLNIGLSWLFQIIIVRGRPLHDGFENAMLLFNEMMVSFYLYVLISLTDYNDDDTLFDNCGIALLSIVMISFVVNFAKFVFFTLRAIYRCLRKLFCKQALTADLNPKKTVAIKPNTLEDYSSDVTLDGQEVIKHMINRGPGIKKISANSFGGVTESRDFTSKSYYEEDDLNVSNDNQANQHAPYKIKSILKKIPPPSDYLDQFPDEDI